MRLAWFDSAVFRPHRDLSVILTISATANAFCASFTIFYFLSQRYVDTIQAALFVVVIMAASLAAAVLIGATRIGRLGIRKLILVGFCCSLTFYVSLLFVDIAPIPVGVAAALSFGGFIFVFFVPYNTAVLRLTTEGNRSTVLGAYGLIFPVVATVAPLGGGFVIDHAGYPATAAIALALVVTNFVFVWRFADLEPGEPVVLDRALFSRIPVRASVGLAFNGLFDGSIWAGLPIIALLYVGRTSDYGTLISVLSLFGAVAAVVLGRVSDRVRDRRTFLTVGLVLLVPAALIGIGVESLLGFMVAMSLVNLGLPIAGVFLFALAGDAASTRPQDVAYLREILLDAGRLVAAVAVTLIVLVAHWPQGAFLVMLIASVGMGVARAVEGPTRTVVDARKSPIG